MLLIRLLLFFLLANGWIYSVDSDVKIQNKSCFIFLYKKVAIIKKNPRTA